LSVIHTIKTYHVADLPYLLRLVLRSIYDRDNMPAEDIHLMMHSMIKWNTHLKDKIEQYNERFKLDGTQTTDEHSALQEYLIRLGWLLQRDADGKFERRKMLFKLHRIDYRKFHRLPEAYTPEGIAAAQEQYKKYAQKNPEQEFMGVQSSPEVQKAMETARTLDTGGA